ncbi:MAG: AmmeMemoRadiSam system radical SAM enzyme [Sedimentisphaerales bacterium]|nr:AmmeMemoRadiSam system radical SAM enzyme [Sedimentisphaerales bacterium]
MQTYNAILWQKADNNKVSCNLCPHHCQLAPDQHGLCNGRHNERGIMINHCYYDICSASVDPIEKKPLFHFLPGSKAMSIATPGCNFKCSFCQNAAISMPRPGALPLSQGITLTISQVIESALLNKCSSIAYTYTEPTIYLELAADCGQLAHQHNLKNIIVSNGYMTPEAADYASKFIDAANIDLKSFSEDFYRNQCKGSLEPVLQTLEYFASQPHIWLEVTTLLIPGLNDSPTELFLIASFIADKLGKHVPWHISRFHPANKCTNIPPTSIDSLQRAYQIGRQVGLNYVYIGNAPGIGMENTLCPACGETVIERAGYQLGKYSITNNKCTKCGQQLDGVFANKTTAPLS